MKRLLIALSLLAFMPSVTLATTVKKIDVATGRYNCLTVSINGKTAKYCSAGDDGYIISQVLFNHCSDIGGKKRELYCIAPSDGGIWLTILPVEPYE